MEHYFYVSWTALCKLAKLYLSSQILTKTFFREEEREKREADMRREMEERDKQHREIVERLQSQVRLLGPVWIYFSRPGVSL